MTAPNNTADPVPASAWLSFNPVTGGPPAMPPYWTATVLLQPFSPPQSNDPNPTTPFFELCVGAFAFVQGAYFSAQITGCVSGNTWWYFIDEYQTQLSFNSGDWMVVDMGWSLPTNWFGGEASNAVCSGSSPLNWMNAQTVDWWRVPVPNTNPPAATWVWFDSNTGAPVRMMFGDGPAASPNMGDQTQLAILQMYSFSYFPVFEQFDAQNASIPRTAQEMRASSFVNATFPGFAVDNPNGYQNFVWNGNFGTVFMTPVNENFSPLPTRVLYVWKPDDEYSVYSDRAQNTLMAYNYNPGDMTFQEALLTGPASSGVTPPPNSDTSFLINFYDDQDPTCVGAAQGFRFSAGAARLGVDPRSRGDDSGDHYEQPGALSQYDGDRLFGAVPAVAAELSRFDVSLDVVRAAERRRHGEPPDHVHAVAVRRRRRDQPRAGGLLLL